MHNSGPESIKGHAAVRLGNKGRGKVGRQNKDSARLDALAGSVVGNCGNVVNAGSRGGVGSVVSIGVSGDHHSVVVDQATKSIIWAEQMEQHFLPNFPRT